MKISFIVPAYNEEQYIVACIDGIFSCNDPTIYEVIVVDNGSTDHTGEILQNLQKKYGEKLIVLHEPQKGPTHARQAALRAVRGDFIACVDADCRPDSQWLQAMKKAIETHPNATAWSGPYRYYDLPLFWKALKFLKDMIYRPFLFFYTFDRLFGGNVIMRRDALERIQGFSEKLIYWGEDIDLAIRLSAIGPVYYSAQLSMPGSARRFLKGGILKTYFLYNINEFYQHISKKPITSAKEEDYR